MAQSRRKKNITIDDLAKMVARGFTAQDKKSGKRFDKIEQRLGGVDQRLGGVDQRLGGVEQRLGGVEQRLDGVEYRLTAMGQRIDELEEKFEKRFNEVMTAIDGLVKLQERYYHEQVSLGVKVDRHEEWIKQIAGKMGIQLKR